jgi:hypothetical protein
LALQLKQQRISLIEVASDGPGAHHSLPAAGFPVAAGIVVCYKDVGFGLKRIIDSDLIGCYG